MFAALLCGWWRGLSLSRLLQPARAGPLEIMSGLQLCWPAAGSAARGFPNHTSPAALPLPLPQSLTLALTQALHALLLLGPAHPGAQAATAAALARCGAEPLKQASGFFAVLASRTQLCWAALPSAPDVLCSREGSHPLNALSHQKYLIPCDAHTVPCRTWRSWRAGWRSWQPWARRPLSPGTRPWLPTSSESLN